MTGRAHPVGVRIGVSQQYKSNWFAKNTAEGTRNVYIDGEIRKFLHSSLERAGIGEIFIERPSKDSAVVILEAVKPGLIIGHKGKEIDSISSKLSRKIGAKVAININEIRNPDIHPACIASRIIRKLREKVHCKRVMKNAALRSMKSGAKGVYIECSGVISRIAKNEKKLLGGMPFGTFKSKIKYHESVAVVPKVGKIGVKVAVIANSRSAKLEAQDRDRRKSKRTNSDSASDRRRPRADDKRRRISAER